MSWRKLSLFLEPKVIGRSALCVEGKGVGRLYLLGDETPVQVWGGECQEGTVMKKLGLTVTVWIPREQPGVRVTCVPSALPELLSARPSDPGSGRESPGQVLYHTLLGLMSQGLSLDSWTPSGVVAILAVNSSPIPQGHPVQNGPGNQGGGGRSG